MSEEFCPAHEGGTHCSCYERGGEQCCNCYERHKEDRDEE